jgi:predicted transposase YbfD/YdcC
MTSIFRASAKPSPSSATSSRKKPASVRPKPSTASLTTPRTGADAAAVLAYNRGHWTVENSCHYILDWNWDEDRCTIRTGHGPANITALRRFAIGAIKAKSRDTVAATIQRLARNVRLVFDYLGMTENSCRRPQGRPATPG